MASRPKFYLPALDSLRFFAFLMVFHRPRLITGYPLLQSISDRIYVSGWVGVDLFFCISSFLITELLSREYLLTGAISIRMFYIRRVLRIWPLYFLALLAVYVVFPLLHVGVTPGFGAPERAILVREYLLPFILFLGNAAIAVKGFPPAGALGILWTVCIEEQFYLAWPALMWLLLRRGKVTQYVALNGLLLFTIAVRAICFWAQTPYHFVYTNTLARLDPFIIGALVSFLLREKGLKSWLGGWKAYVVGGMGLGVVMALGAHEQFSQNSNRAPMIGFYTVLALAFGAWLVPLILAFGWFARAAAWKPLCWLGKISYGLYIYQVVAMFYAERLFAAYRPPGLDPRLAWAVEVGLGILITVGLATLSYYGYERFFLRLKSRFTIVENKAV